MHASADYGSIAAIQERLIEASDGLSGMIDHVAKARQIVLYDSDRRKRALSCAVKDHLDKGESATAAEHHGRASDTYGELMKAIGKDLLVAEAAIAEWDAMKIKWETARSLLSIQKQIVGNL